jgi:hypothetical protein
MFVPSSTRHNFFKYAALTWNPGSAPDMANWSRLLPYLQCTDITST